MQNHQFMIINYLFKLAPFIIVKIVQKVFLIIIIILNINDINKFF